MSNKILITCAIESIPVLTGFKAPPGTALTGLKRVKLPNCPACGQTHIWNGEDAYWGEEEPEPSFFDAVRSFLPGSKRSRA
jgi:hypothetical protein